MTGNINDVISASHDKQIPLMIDKTAIAGEVVPRIGCEVPLLKTAVVTPDRRQARRWKRPFDHDGTLFSRVN